MPRAKKLSVKWKCEKEVHLVHNYSVTGREPRKNVLFTNYKLISFVSEMPYPFSCYIFRSDLTSIKNDVLTFRTELENVMISLVPGSLPWVNRLLLLTFLKRPIIYGSIEVSNSHKFFLQAAYNWIYVITFFTNFLSSWKKKLLLKSSQYSHSFLLKRDSLVKKRLQHSCFPVNIANCFGTPILKNNCERLPLRLTLGSQPRVSS